MDSIQYAPGLSGPQPMPENLRYDSAAFRLAYKMMYLSTRLSRPEKGIKRSRIMLPGKQGESIPCYVVEPEQVQAGKNCIIYIHGGAFVAELSKYNLQIASYYAKELGCKVFLPEYRTAFRVKYPVPVEDCMNAIRAIYERKEEFGIGKRMALYAESSGACLALAAALRARDAGHSPVSYQMLISPCLDYRTAGESYRQFPRAAIPTSMIQWAWSNYLGGKEPENVGDASPLYADDFRNLPKTYLEAEEFDCLRDDAKSLHLLLNEAGVDTEYHMALGSYHGVEAEFKTEYVKKLMADRCKALADEINS